jgi:hypothetical protein
MAEVLVPAIGDVKQIEVHTSEPLGHSSSRLEVEVVAKLKKYKSPGSDSILTTDTTGSARLWSEIHNGVYYCISLQKGSKTNLIIIMGYHRHLLYTTFCHIPFPQGHVSVNRLNYWGSSVWLLT